MLWNATLWTNPFAAVSPFPLPSHKVLAIPVLLCLVCSCAHQALVETDPPGAEVYVNGEKVGHAPVSFEDPGGWSRDYEVTLRKDGYELKQVTLTQDVFNPMMLVGAGVCGACTLGAAALYFIPRSRHLEDRYHYVLKRKEPLPPLEGPPTAPAPTPPAATGSGSDVPGAGETSAQSFRY